MYINSFKPKYIFHCTDISPLNAELNPIRHLLALVGARHIVHVSRIRVNNTQKANKIVVNIFFTQLGPKRTKCAENRAKFLQALN